MIKKKNIERRIQEDLTLIMLQYFSILMRPKYKVRGRPVIRKKSVKNIMTAKIKPIFLPSLAMLSAMIVKVTHSPKR